ncbi:MAG: LacI family DNA-binding transcriptional regulator [Lentisphaeria bacterium]|nr:LacI family DNA-binding transcriptional regulator [Lentisphaeria bacterium]
MAVTVREVAAEAGVSFQLASAVLGKKKYAHASESTREKILNAAKKLCYIPNASARILRGDSSRIIGVLIDSRAPENMYNILAETVLAADEKGYRILTAQAHDDPEKLMQSCNFLKENGVEGIISFSHDYAQLGFHLDQRLKDDPKIVFVLNTDESNHAAVDVDFTDAMKRALIHLREKGYCKTALFLSGAGIPEKYPISCLKRIEGFTANCPEGKVLHLHSSISNIPELEKECHTLVRDQLLAEGFDSAIALTDLHGVILMNQLMKEGIRIPEDFGVIGCDNLPVGECFPVKLTTLHYDRKKIARAAMEIMLSRIAGDTKPNRKEFPLQLIVRESTARNKV